MAPIERALERVLAHNRVRDRPLMQPFDCAHLIDCNAPKFSVVFNILIVLVIIKLASFCSLYASMAKTSLISLISLNTDRRWARHKYVLHSPTCLIYALLPRFAWWLELRVAAVTSRGGYKLAAEERESNRKLFEATLEKLNAPRRRSTLPLIPASTPTPHQPPYWPPSRLSPTINCSSGDIALNERVIKSAFGTRPHSIETKCDLARNKWEVSDETIVLRKGA